jgi:hypothetical protein
MASCPCSASSSTTEMTMTDRQLHISKDDHPHGTQREISDFGQRSGL